jgi:hypothetical protein
MSMARLWRDQGRTSMQEGTIDVHVWELAFVCRMQCCALSALLSASTDAQNFAHPIR